MGGTLWAAEPIDQFYSNPGLGGPGSLIFFQETHIGVGVPCCKLIVGVCAIDSAEVLRIRQAKKEVGIKPFSLPPRSPDLNPLDYSIWAEINKRMRKQELAWPKAKKDAWFELRLHIVCICCATLVLLMVLPEQKPPGSVYNHSGPRWGPRFGRPGGKYFNFLSPFEEPNFDFQRPT